MTSTMNQEPIDISVNMSGSDTLFKLTNYPKVRFYNTEALEPGVVKIVSMMNEPEENSAWKHAFYSAIQERLDQPLHIIWNRGRIAPRG